MIHFRPQRAYIEEDAWNYPLTKKIEENLNRLDIPLENLPPSNRVTGIPGRTSAEKYIQAKQTLVVAVRKTLKFQTCKPSAHYQLPLVTGCPGLCQYCYLQTTLGPRPAIRIYVNLEDIFAQAASLIAERSPEETVFEGSATSDPVAVEHLCGSLREAILFFASQKEGRFRFVTKFADVDSLLNLPHRGRTEFRFSLNTRTIIERHERSTASSSQRIAAARRVIEAGYPTGFLIAPIIIYDNWRHEYGELLATLADELPAGAAPSFELITHRFTARAKANIERVFPANTLPMDESERQFKFGQFGYGKYVYPKTQMEEIRTFFGDKINALFPRSEIKYLV